MRSLEKPPGCVIVAFEIHSGIEVVFLLVVQWCDRDRKQLVSTSYLSLDRHAHSSVAAQTLMEGNAAFISGTERDSELIRYKTYVILHRNVYASQTLTANLFTEETFMADGDLNGDACAFGI
jgi:hypothetical protein